MDHALRTSRRLNRLALLLLAVIGLAVGLIGRGALDPLPTGPADGQATFGAIMVPIGTSVTISRTLTVGTTVVGLTGRWADAAVDGQYGLALLDAAGELRIGIERGGDVGIWRQQGAQERALRPSGPWPHSRPAPAENEIMVVRAGDRLAVWLNRERLWEGAASGPWARAAVFGTSHTGVGTIGTVELRWYR